MKEFDKTILNIDEKISLLKQRWLIVDDLESAKHHLQHIWYFRLTWYFKFFQDKETNTFKDWTTFEQVVRLYSFDRKLRLLTLDAIEKIEVSLKANMSYEMYKLYWAFWYLNEELFYLKKEKFKSIYDELIKKIKNKYLKSSSLFVENYFKNYSNEHLPCWMLFEELTIWEISNIYKILKKENQLLISNKYSVDFSDLVIRIQAINHIRNISAHHSRLCNKEFIFKLSVKDKKLWSKFLFSYEKNKKEVIPNYYNFSLIINYLLKNINKNFCWLDDLEKLFNDFSDISKNVIWFKNWKDNFTQ